MRPDEIGRSYDQIAAKWLEPHLQVNGISAFQRALQFVKKRGHALDVGCGCNPRFLDLLTEAGFQVEGVDVSEKMVALARQNRPNLIFHHADILQWSLQRKYDFISAWDSTWHLPLAEQEPFMRKVCAGLAPGGVFIFTTGGLDEPSEKTDSTMGPPVSYSVLGIPRTLELLTKLGCVCRHLEYDQHPELHVYLIAQKNG